MEIRRSGFRNFSKSGRSGSGRDQEIVPPVKLPQVIDETFQDITHEKIQFNTGYGYTEVMVVTVTKEPNQTTKVSTFPRFVGDKLVALDI